MVRGAHAAWIACALGCGPTAATGDGGGGGSQDGTSSSHTDSASQSSTSPTGSSEATTDASTESGSTDCDACDPTKIALCVEPPGIAVTSVEVAGWVENIVGIDVDGAPDTAPLVVTMNGEGWIETRNPAPDLGILASSPTPFGIRENHPFRFGPDAFGDMVGITPSQEYTYVHAGDGAGGFTSVGPGLHPDSGHFEDIAVADFDGDGNDDIALLVSDGQVDSIMIAFGTGNGVVPELGPQVALFNGASMDGLAVTAHAGDAAPDLVVARTLEEDVLGLANNGDGTFVTTPGAHSQVIKQVVAPVVWDDTNAVATVGEIGETAKLVLWRNDQLADVVEWELPPESGRLRAYDIEQLELGLGRVLVFTTPRYPGQQLHVIYDLDCCPCMASHAVDAERTDFAIADVDPGPGSELLMSDGVSILIVDLTP